MEVQIAVAKINKYASSESGDTLEVIERRTADYLWCWPMDKRRAAARKRFQ